MQIESEKRYKSSKKPNVFISLENTPDKKSLKFIFENVNISTSIISFDLANISEIKELDIGRSAIVSNYTN